jgi:hypothetical protein
LNSLKRPNQKEPKPPKVRRSAIVDQLLMMLLMLLMLVMLMFHLTCFTCKTFGTFGVPTEKRIAQLAFCPHRFVCFFLTLYPNDSTEHGAALEDLRRSSECCFLPSQVVSCDIFDMSLVSFCRFSSIVSS